MIGFLYRHFGTLQKLLFGTGIMQKSEGRQPYHVGWLAEGKTLEDLRFHLHGEWGFGNHFISFTEKGEVLNWRKLEESGKQYHLRVYRDGEIRGHLEYQPEGHTMDHLLAREHQEAKTDFLKFLGEFAVYNKTVSDLKPPIGAYEPDAEYVHSDKPST